MRKLATFSFNYKLNPFEFLINIITYNIAFFSIYKIYMKLLFTTLILGKQERTPS